MKKTILLIIALFLTQNAFGQDRDQIKQKLQDIGTLQPNSNVLVWLTTTNDFPQADLSIEEIDKKIDAIILKQKDKQAIDIETPINLKKIKYYGFSDVNKIGIIGNSTLISDPKYSALYEDAIGNYYNKQFTPGKNIYEYENVKILATYNSYEDQLHVYSIIRSLLILKNRYPQIYKDLFTATESSPLLNDKLTRDIDQNGSTVLNINKNYVISIHENNSKNSNSTYSSMSSEFTQNFPERLVSDNNTHLIFLNKNTVRNGGAASGANPIYANADSQATAHINYLFDGLIQTIVHERLHDYIANQMTLNRYFNYLRNNAEFVNTPTTEAQKKDTVNFCEPGTYECIEEPIVTNTTNKLFETYGGMSTDVMKYYKDLFQKTQLPKMKKATKFDQLIKTLKPLNKKASGNGEEDTLAIYF